MRLYSILSLICLFCGTMAQPARADAENKNSSRHDPPVLQEKVTFSFLTELNTGFVLDHMVEDFACAVFVQTHTVIAIETMLPLNDEPIKALPLATLPISQWLVLLRQESPTLEWTVADNTVHIILHSAHDFPNVLDQPLKEDCSGTRTLDGWQTLISHQYPKDHFLFNNIGKDDWMWDTQDTEWQTREFPFHAKKGTTLRSYFTRLACAYGSGFLLVDMQKQPPPGYWRIYSNYVNFWRVNTSKAILSMTGNYSH